MKLRVTRPKHQDWTAITEGAILSGIAVTVAYFLDHVHEYHLGTYGPVIVGVLTILGHVLRKVVQIDFHNHGHRKKKN